MDMSAAEIGVWFNGEDHAYLRKIVHKDGRRTYQELPNIPRKGQRIEDIGLYRRRDLKPASNLKAVFRDLRNHLAGNAKRITRDEALAQEIMNILFCKIYDEVNTGRDEIVTFRSGHGEAPDDVKARILTLFEKVKAEYNDVFNERDAIELDPDSIVYIVGELQTYAVTEADRDAVGDAFEVFIGPALRGPEGQFFTPRNVVHMVIEMLDPDPTEMILDTACGSGGFLIRTGSDRSLAAFRAATQYADENPVILFCDGELMSAQQSADIAATMISPISTALHTLKSELAGVQSSQSF